MPSELQLHPVKLNCKLEYKSHYMYDMICRDDVISAMTFVNCLNKIHTTVPLEGSEQDRMLQACELKLNPNNENYPHDALHV